jgi:hypothetical protein
MSWKNQLRDDPLPWLLEPEDPGVRYLALRDLLERPPDDPNCARAASHTRKGRRDDPRAHAAGRLLGQARAGL